MTLYYTGIGSRETPKDVLKKFTELGTFLAEKEYVLRSGGANGADASFELGCDLGQGKKDIFLPWRKFNDNQSILYYVSEEAIKLASENHPAWEKVSIGARKLMGRNCYQVLGYSLNKPSEFVVGYTKVVDGKRWGGTSLAMNLADLYKIPVFNFFLDDDILRFEKFIGDIKKSKKSKK